MGQEQTSPTEEEQNLPVDPPSQEDNDGSVEAAASIFSNMLDEDGKFAASQETPDEPKKEEPKPEQPKAEEAKSAALAVKFGDKEWNVSIPEDMPEEFRSLVKDGLLMRADYTRKTQEIAEVRKQTEAKAQELMGAFQMVNALPTHLAQIQSVEAQLQQFQSPELWQRLESDPLGKIEAKQAFQDLQNQRQHLYGQMNYAQQQMTAYTAKQNQERMQAAIPKVKEAIPDFGPAVVKEMREFGKSLGFTDQQLDQTYDAPPLILLYKAMQADKLQADMAKQKAAIQQKVEKLPPKQVRSGVAETPGTGPRMNQAASQRLKSSGSVTDAAAVINSLLG